MSIYKEHTYLENNPSWHLEDAPFKARHISSMIERNRLELNEIAEVGCGAGGVLHEVSKSLGDSVKCFGYDISGDAIAMAKQFERENLKFEELDVFQTKTTFDLLLVIDVFEHVPDYLGFIEQCQNAAKYKIFHVPLDVHISSIMRGTVTSAREKVGHLHYFTQESVLATINASCKRIIDFQYTPTAIELYREHPSLKRGIANVPRWLVSCFSTHLASKLFGGYSLLVLAE